MMMMMMMSSMNDAKGITKLARSSLVSSSILYASQMEVVGAQSQQHILPIVCNIVFNLNSNTHDMDFKVIMTLDSFCKLVAHMIFFTFM